MWSRRKPSRALYPLNNNAPFVTAVLALFGSDGSEHLAQRGLVQLLSFCVRHLFLLFKAGRAPGGLCGELGPQIPIPENPG